MAIAEGFNPSNDK